MQKNSLKLKKCILKKYNNKKPPEFFHVHPFSLNRKEKSPQNLLHNTGLRSNRAQQKQNEDYSTKSGAEKHAHGDDITLQNEEVLHESGTPLAADLRYHMKIASPAANK